MLHEEKSLLVQKALRESAGSLLRNKSNTQGRRKSQPVTPRKGLGSVTVNSNALDYESSKLVQMA